ncbi:Uncharacterised protein [Mycobacteroides abscessus subsp. abscessus]|nr:Uncharacterised protein [Mycobacteroides abscessus subsp. abscessus]
MRHISPICQRGNGSPGYHFPWLRCTSPSGAQAAFSWAVSADASVRLCGPSAAVVHSSSVWLSIETKVGSPPTVNRTSRSAIRSSMTAPRARIDSHACSVYGRVTRGSSCTRVTTLTKSRVDSQGSTAPVIGAADSGCGVADSGMWPSPASRPEVGSRPTQPAPGMYTSVQACRSVKSAAGPEGPSSASTSALSWTR